MLIHFPEFPVVADPLPAVPPVDFMPPRPRTEIDRFPEWWFYRGEGFAVVEIVGSGWSPGVMQDFNGSGA